MTKRRIWLLVLMLILSVWTASAYAQYVVYPSTSAVQWGTTCVWPSAPLYADPYPTVYPQTYVVQPAYTWRQVQGWQHVRVDVYDPYGWPQHYIRYDLRPYYYWQQVRVW